MDESAPTHERRKLVKTYKNVLPQKLIVVAEVCRETNSKKIETGVEKWPHKIRGTQREKGSRKRLIKSPSLRFTSRLQS